MSKEIELFEVLKNKKKNNEFIKKNKFLGKGKTKNWGDGKSEN